MPRRLIFVGGLDELDEVVQQNYGARIVPGEEYVFGRWCNATAESGLLWADLHRNMTKARLTPKQRYACQQYYKLKPLRKIAEQMGLDVRSVRIHIDRGLDKLDALPRGNLGCWTQIVEACGGHRAVKDYAESLK